MYRIHIASFIYAVGSVVTTWPLRLPLPLHGSQQRNTGVMELSYLFMFGIF